jgi:hypothetical protein
VIQIEEPPKSCVVHFDSGTNKAHATIINYKGTVYFFANSHTLEITYGMIKNVDIEYPVYIKGKFDKVLYSSIWLREISSFGDVSFCQLIDRKGKQVSPPVKPMKVSTMRVESGRVPVQLVGCDVCKKQTVVDFSDLSDRLYKINTEIGDCGRPVVFHDKHYGDGVFIFLGIHRWGNIGPGGKFNGFERIRSSDMPKNESIEYFDMLPGGSMSPASAYIFDSFATQYFDKDVIDISKYEIKRITKEIAAADISKYSSSDWIFENKVAINLTLRHLEYKFYGFLQSLSKRPESMEDFREMCKRTGDGTLSHTSPGFPWGRLYKDKVEAVDDTYVQMWEAIQDGSILDHPSIFTLFIKDEVRAKAKKARSIVSSPLHHFMPCVYLFHGAHCKSKYTAGHLESLSSIGINVLVDLGYTWANMFRETGLGGSYDVDAMDTTVSSQVMELIFSVWRKYIPDSDLDLFDKLVWEANHTFIRLADGSIWLKHGGNPSGWYMTGDLNTWVSAFYFYYVITCWFLDSGHGDFALDPTRAINNFVYSKHNGDDTIFSFRTKTVIPKDYFNGVWKPFVTVTWDDVNHSVSSFKDCTYLSMAPVPDEEVWRPIRPDCVQLVHCKLERPITKMFYRTKTQKPLILYNKVVNIMILCYYSKKWYDFFREIKHKLEERYENKLHVLPDVLCTHVRGEPIEEHKNLIKPPKYFVDQVRGRPGLKLVEDGSS